MVNNYRQDYNTVLQCSYKVAIHEWSGNISFQVRGTTSEFPLYLFTV
jgi:hypothetical protein